jgi:hypothetical protein
MKRGILKGNFIGPSVQQLMTINIQNGGKMDNFIGPTDRLLSISMGVIYGIS